MREEVELAVVLGIVLSEHIAEFLQELQRSLLNDLGEERFEHYAFGIQKPTDSIKEEE